MLDSPDEAIEEFEDFLSLEIEPLKQAGKLAAVLLQFPPFFGEREFRSNLDTFAHIGGSKLPVFAELRDRNLLKERSEWLRSNGIGIVAVDSPDYPLSLFHEDSQYFRFHGRNSKDWNSRNGMEKYRYNYSNEELSHLFESVSRSLANHDQIFIYFNNHPGGNGPRNALAMSSFLAGSGSVQGRIY